MDHNAGALPPAGALNNSNQTRGGSGNAMTGKVERTVGAMVGSSALKAKGLQKEQYVIIYFSRFHYSCGVFLGKQIPSNCRALSSQKLNVLNMKHACEENVLLGTVRDVFFRVILF